MADTSITTSAFNDGYIAEQFEAYQADPSSVDESWRQFFRLGGALDASRDLECLTQAVYYEARGETPDGQSAVAQVV